MREKIVSPFARSILAEIDRLPNAGVAFFQQATGYKPCRLKALSSLIQNSNHIIHRGVSIKEVRAICESDRFEKKVKYGDTAYDILAFLRENENDNFISFSPDIFTVYPYLASMSLVPKTGAIISSTYPKVYMVPQKMLALSPEDCDAYDARCIAQSNLDSVGRYRGIREFLLRNNEVTAVINGPNGEDWTPTLSSDTAQLLVVGCPGEFGAFVTADKTLHQVTLENSDFQPRPLAVEVVALSNLKKASEHAVKAGLIQKENRLLSLNDAACIWKNQDYDTFQLRETLHLGAVDASIKEGDEAALVQYVQEKLEDRAEAEDAADENRGNDFRL